MFPDSSMLTDRQRQELCRMMYEAFLEIRILGWEGKAEQAAAVADAFHELPRVLWSENCSLVFLRGFLQAYSEKYPSGWGQNYMKRLDEISNLTP